MFRSGYKALLVLLFVLAGSVPLAAYYYFPDNQPPGPPPNYNQIDPEYFYGVPPMEEMIQRDGYFIYFDSSESLWTINSVIPSGTPAFEQFHGAILVQLEEEPMPGVNVFPLGFDLTDDLHRNDRWGWVRWPDSIAPYLYEIWWDITIDCPGALVGCSRTIGFWKTHAGFGPQEDVVTPLLPVWLGTPDGARSLFVNTAAIAVDILSEDVYGDESNGITKLYAQLLAAKLNILSGASDMDVADVMSAADAFLAEHDWTDWENLNAQDRKMVLGWKDTLDDYNNGYIGPGDCDGFSEDDMYTGDSTCFIGITFKGCAFDFNLWGSGYNRTFDADHIYLGRYMEPLGHIVEFEDTFEGIFDPYGHPFDCDTGDGGKGKGKDNDCLEPNLSVFTRIMLPGASYNYDGMIETGDDYGDTYGGSRVYNGNGIEFSVYDCEENNPPTFEPPVGFMKPVTLCLGSTVYDTIIANDFDPGDTVTVVKLSGPGEFSSTPDVPPVYGYFTWTPTEEGEYAVVFQATDQHGATIIDSVIYSITFDRPPTAYAHDTTMFVCWETDEVCYTVTADDAEDDPLTFALLSGTGSIDALTGKLCFTPGGVGQYPFTVEVSDSCGADTVDFTVSILKNSDPMILPYDSIIRICYLDSVCCPVEASDPDPGDILEITLLDGPGVFIQTGNTEGVQCFLPDSLEGGRYVFYFQVTDECWREAKANGMKVSDPPSDSVVIVIELNQSPEITCPEDQSVFLCVPDTLCYEITATDPDGDDLTYGLVMGPGDIDPITGHYCMYADTEGTYPIIISATDTCGNFDTCSFTVNIDLNQPPVVDIADTTVELCGLQEICIPYSAFDADDNIVSISGSSLQPGLVVIKDGLLCLTPEAAGEYDITITVIDACGDEAVDQAVITVLLVEDVSIDCPAEPYMVSLCGPDTVCLDIPVSPPDVEITILEPGATYIDGKLCTYVEESGVYKFTLVAAGECNVDTCLVIINAVIDEAPVVICPEPSPVHLCGPDSISVPLTVSPPSAIVTITPRAIFADGYLTFYADSPGDYAFTVVAENDCGADTCYLLGPVTMDSPPQVTIADSVFHLCELQEICVPYEYSDPDNNVVSVRVTPLKTIFKLTDGNVCFTPPGAGTYELVLTVTDSCGLSASDTATVTVTLNQPPSVVVADTTVFTCDSTDICLPVTAFDADGTIISIDVEPPAYYDADNGVVCLPVDGSGTYLIGVVVYDDCGTAAVDTGVAIVTFNSPPEVTAPTDTVVSLCDPQEICLGGFEVFDIDDNIVTIEFSPDLGYYESGTYCFLPDTAGTYCLVITVTDACGETASDTVCVTFELGIDVVINCPDAIKVTELCGPDSVCHTLPQISPSDASVTVLEPGAVIVDSTLCFYAESSGIYVYTLVAIGECGADTCVLEIPVSINEPPQVTCPDTVQANLCGPDSVCAEISYSPPTASIHVVEPGAIMDGNRLCFYAESPGVYTYTIVATGECGEDTCQVVFDITLDSPPLVTCPEPVAVSLCEPDSISVPLAISPSDANITITPPASYADGYLTFFADGDGEYCFEVIAENSCGTDTCSFCVTVTVNAPPQVTIADSSIYLCDLEEICVPYSYFDPDDDVVSVTVEPSRYSIVEGFVCFTPPGAGDYEIILTVADSCGNSAVDTAIIQITLNMPPVVDVDDTALFLCEPADVCLPITFSDPDGIVDSIVVGTPAYYDSDNRRVCFPVSVSGQFEIPVTVYDTCGAGATATGIIIATVNSDPVVTVPNDTSMILCDTAEVCLVGFDFTDIDDNLGVIEFIPDIGLYGGGEYCFTPDTAGTYCIIARATDSCGAVAEDTVCITLDWGENAVIDCPGPLADTICEPDSICIPIPVQPFDAKVDILEADGIYVAGELCFYADSTGIYTFTVVATGECDADTCLTTVDVTLDEPPVVTCPAPDPIFLCEPDSVLIPLSITPSYADVVVSPDAIYDDGQLRFYADKEGDICFEVIASTLCGADTCEFCVSVSLNDPPLAYVPDTAIALCDIGEVCIPVDYSDANGNIRSVVITPDTYTLVNDSICFVPAGEGTHEIIVTVTDSCDVQAVDTGTIDISLNTGPTAVIGQSEPLYSCELQDVCAPVTIDDPDDNIVSIITGATCGDPVLNDALDSLCWTPASFGICTLTVIVEDVCGESDTANAVIELIQAPDPDPPCLPDDTVVVCAAGQVCVDIPAIEGEHYFVTKPDIYTIFPQTNTMCWIADVNRTDTITIIDSTLCGVDSCNFVMTSLINRPPEIASVASIDTAFCHAATLCVDYDVSDPDGNIDTVLVSGTCPNAVLDIVNSRVCLELADAVECELRLIVLDDCGLADTALVQIIAVPNRPPNVNLPSIETVVRCETDTSAIVIADICVTDPDYDEVTLALDSGLGEFAFDPLYDCGELTFMPPTNDTAEYCFKFMATDFCDTVYELFCINVLPSAVCSTCVEVAIEGPPCVNSGGQAIVNITAETFNKIGGYDLLVGYDASALNFVHADLGLDVSGWEYFTYRFGDLGNCEAPCPSGLLKLVAIADINNGPFHPPQEQLSPMGTIAAITFRVSSDLNFGGQRVPVRFFWMGCSDNGFSDPTGQYFYVDYIIFSPEGNIVWDEFNDDVYPDEDRPPHIGAPDSCLVGDKYTPVRCVSFHNGEVCIQHPDSIDKRGDMNLNGVQYEIADAVVYTNYFISGLSAFSISVAGQIAASDVNADGITLSIGDLVYLIRVIVGDAPPYPKPRIEDEVLAATCTQRAGEASVRIESTGDIGGVLMVFDGENIESVIPTPGDDAGNMEMKYGWLAGNLRVLLYSMKPGGKIPSGTAELVRLQLPADGTVELVEIEMADYYGRELTTAVSNPALPKELHLSQNRPNPFNPNTTFELALPKASEYTLTIYNIMGQVIRRWAGYSEAGYISFEWDGRDQNSEPVASGIYFYRAEALGQDSIRKMILLK